MYRHRFRFFVHIVKNPMFADPQFPSRLSVFPGWVQSGKDFFIACPHIWLIRQLLVNASEYSLPVGRSDFCQVVGDVFGKFNGKYLRLALSHAIVSSAHTPA
jgi:hypothetical protein